MFDSYYFFKENSVMVSALITPTIKKCSIIYCYICIPVPWNTCVKSYLKKVLYFIKLTCLKFLENDHITL